MGPQSGSPDLRASARSPSSTEDDLFDIPELDDNPVHVYRTSVKCVSGNPHVRKADVWVPKYADAEARSEHRLRIMRSNRWFPGSTTKVALRGIPFVNKGGHISGSTELIWKGSAAEFFATVVRRVFDVLKKRLSPGRYKKGRSTHRDLILKIAAWYTITLDDAGLERICRCDYKFRRGLHHYLMLQMDDQKRFLYGQLLQSSLWLQSRGSCNPRAKSIAKTDVIPLYFLRLKDGGSTKRSNTEYLNWWADAFVYQPVRIQFNPLGRPNHIPYGWGVRIHEQVTPLRILA